MQKTLGLAIALVALFPVLAFQSGEENLFNSLFLISWPELSIIGAAFCSTYGWVILRILVKDKELSPLIVNGVGMSIGALMAFLHSFLFDTWNPIPIEQGKFGAFFLSVSMMTLVSNLICYNLYSYLLKRLTATFLSFVGLLSPIFTSISSFIILGEAISWQIILSTFFMLLAMWMVYRSEIAQGYIKKANVLKKEIP